MLTPELFAALMDILSRHVEGRLTIAEGHMLNLILSTIAPPTDQADPQPEQA